MITKLFATTNTIAFLNKNFLADMMKPEIRDFRNKIILIGDAPMFQIRSFIEIAFECQISDSGTGKGNNL